MAAVPVVYLRLHLNYESYIVNYALLKSYYANISKLFYNYYNVYYAEHVVRKT